MTALNSEWRGAAQRVFAAHLSIATVSIVHRRLLTHLAPDLSSATVVQAATATWPTCFINPAAAELIDPEQRGPQWSPDALSAVIGAASLRGLQHAWVVVDEGGATRVEQLVQPYGERVVICPLRVDATSAPRPMALGIDAAWLLGGESGAQVFVCELLKAMAKTDAISMIVLLSDSGDVPAALRLVPKVSGRTWREAIASSETLDILHRPYQPGVDTDIRKYRQVARAVALTIFDFIAYDNAAYHVSSFAFREYQRAFDRVVCQADQLFAISEHVGGRLQRQFAHRLTAPVRAILPGANHLDSMPPTRVTAAPSALVQAGVARYLLVLGNDFAHKNRDFAVKVFVELCRRGYQGHLVLSGYHLDAGSSYGYEMQAAGAVAARVVRTGPWSPDDKLRVLGHADALLYPTSSEGFGFIPFEAASLGVPTAFVRFGPLLENMPEVPAVAGWRVGAFADHVEALIADPAPFLAAAAAARRALTWERCARQTIDGYRGMLEDAAPRRSELSPGHRPGAWRRATELAAEYSRRIAVRLSLTATSHRNPP